LPVHLAAQPDLPPQPASIASDYFLACSVFADSEGIAEQRWPADVNALAAIRFSVLDPNHLCFSFRVEITELQPAGICLHSAGHSDREERWPLHQSFAAIAPGFHKGDASERNVTFTSCTF